MLNRQLSVNFDNKDSFFYRILKVLELYNLPSVPALIQQPPVRSFTGMDRNGPDYRNGLPEWIFICVLKYFLFGF